MVQYIPLILHTMLSGFVKFWSHYLILDLACGQFTYNLILYIHHPSVYPEILRIIYDNGQWPIQQIWFDWA